MRGLTRHRVLRLSTNGQDDKTKHVTAKQLTQQLMHPPPSPLWSTGGRHWDATSTAWSDHATVPGAEPNQHRSSDRKQMSSGFSSDSGGAASGWQSNSSEQRTAPAEDSGEAASGGAQRCSSLEPRIAPAEILGAEVAHDE